MTEVGFRSSASGEYHGDVTNYLLRTEIAEIHGRLKRARSKINRRTNPEAWGDLDAAITKLEAIKHQLGDDANGLEGRPAES